MHRVTRAADARLGALLALLLLAVNVASVSSRLGFLHKPKQVKEYDHWRYVEMARGPEGARRSPASRPTAFGSRCRRSSGRSRRRVCPINAGFFLADQRGALRLPLPLVAAPERPRLRAAAARDRAPGRRLHAGRRALVRVPVLDERPGRALPRDARLLPARARALGGALRGRAWPRRSSARPTSSSTRTSSCTNGAPGGRGHGRPSAPRHSPRCRSSCSSPSAARSCPTSRTVSSRASSTAWASASHHTSTTSRTW